MYLSTENMCIIRGSCFGHLFDMPSFHNHRQLFRLLFLKLDGGSHGRMRLAFVIGKEVHEFGPVEFAVMTELKFGGSINFPKKSGFHRDVFSENAYIMFYVLEDKFKQTCKQTGGVRCLP